MGCVVSARVRVCVTPITFEQHHNVCSHISPLHGSVRTAAIFGLVLSTFPPSQHYNRHAPCTFHVAPPHLASLCVRVQRPSFTHAQTASFNIPTILPPADNHVFRVPRHSRGHPCRGPQSPYGQCAANEAWLLPLVPTHGAREWVFHTSVWNTTCVYVCVVCVFVPKYQFK